MIIWKDVPYRVWRKYPNYGTGWEYGDVPVVYYNRKTDQFLPVVNPRGNAYGRRRSVRFQIARRRNAQRNAWRREV